MLVALLQALAMFTATLPFFAMGNLEPEMLELSLKLKLQQQQQQQQQEDEEEAEAQQQQQDHQQPSSSGRHAAQQAEKAAAKAASRQLQQFRAQQQIVQYYLWLLCTDGTLDLRKVQKLAAAEGGAEEKLLEHMRSLQPAGVKVWLPLVTEQVISYLCEPNRPSVTSYDDKRLVKSVRKQLGGLKVMEKAIGELLQEDDWWSAAVLLAHVVVMHQLQHSAPGSDQAGPPTGVRGRLQTLQQQQWWASHEGHPAIEQRLHTLVEECRTQVNAVLQQHYDTDEQLLAAAWLQEEERRQQRRQQQEQQQEQQEQEQQQKGGEGGAGPSRPCASNASAAQRAQEKAMDDQQQSQSSAGPSAPELAKTAAAQQQQQGKQKQEQQLKGHRQHQQQQKQGGTGPSTTPGTDPTAAAADQQQQLQGHMDQQQQQASGSVGPSTSPGTEPASQQQQQQQQKGAGHPSVEQRPGAAGPTWYQRVAVGLALVNDWLPNSQRQMSTNSTYNCFLQAFAAGARDEEAMRASLGKEWAQDNRSFTTGMLARCSKVRHKGWC
jgi:hypothetical protein